MSLVSSSSERWTTASLPSALIGRQVEMEALRRALDKAKQGQGGSWLILGPGGMGKTRLLRWLEREGSAKGFQVSWGNGLQESVAPFFVFEQVFRRRSPSRSDLDASGGTGVSAAAPAGELGSYLLFEDDRPRGLRSTLAALPKTSPLLLVTRENPASLHERTSALPTGARSLWITRMEGEGRVSPSDLDGLGEHASRLFHEHDGAILALEGIEYLASQSGFPAVLRLVQFLRDLAQETRGHLLVSVNPAAFERREVSLLESDAEVVRPAGGSGKASADAARDIAGGGESPSARLLRYLRSLETAAREGPQLLVVDDLHWADPQSGTAFQFLARNLRDLPVLLVGGAREDEIPTEAEEEGTALADRIEVLVREGLLERIGLHGFGEEEARALAAQVMGGPMDPAHGQEELKEMLRRTEGNPYFLRELFVQLRQDGTIEEGPEGFVFRRMAGGTEGLLARIPGSLRRMVLQRIGHLSPHERAFLETASVAGSEFELAPVAAVRGISSGDAQTLVASLAHHRRLLEPAMDASGSRWSFSHPLVWEVAIGELRPEQRSREAGALLGWWEEHRPGDVENLARLGHDSEDPARGLPWVHRALERALEAHLPEAAATYLGWARELRLRRGGALDPNEVAGEVEAATRLQRAGGARQSRRLLLSLLAENLPDPLRWSATLVLIGVTDAIDSEEAKRLADQLGAEFAQRGSAVPSKLRHQLEANEAYFTLQAGQAEQAMAATDRLLSMPIEEMDHTTRGRALMLSAAVKHMQGEMEAAHARLVELLEWAGDDDLLLSSAYNIEASLAESTGDDAGSSRSAKKAAACAARGGMFISSAIYEYNAGVGQLKCGQVEEAEATGRHLLDLGNKFGLPRVRCCGHFLISLVADQRKSWGPALASAKRALEEAESLKRNDDIWECRGLLARIHGDSGNLDAAIAQFGELEAVGYMQETIAQFDLGPRFVTFLEQKGLTDRSRKLAEEVLATARKFKNVRVEREMTEALSRLGPKG